MKNNLLRKVLCMILSVAVLLSAMGFTVSATSLKVDPNNPEEHPYDVPSIEEMQTLVGTLSYAEYIATYGALKAGSGSISVEDILAFEATNPDTQVVKDSAIVNQAMKDNPENWVDFGDNADNTLYLPSTGTVTWNFHVDPSEVGLYYIKLDYFSCITGESSVSDIERSFRINGKAPFDEVSNIALGKDWVYDNISVKTEDAPGEKDSYKVDYLWGDGKDAYCKVVTSVKDGVKTVTTYELSQDVNGNSLAPVANATASWSTYYFQDDTGYYTGYFAFYLEDGNHTISLIAERDPMIIRSIEFVPAVETSEMLSYEDYLAQYAGKTDKFANADPTIIQAEFPDKVSNASVASSNDNSSAVNFPILSGTQLYNVLGETGFSSIGQWVEYNFRVSDTGFYNFGMRFRQSMLQGMYVCRTLKLAGGDYGLPDGTPTVPFAEAYNTQFGYSDKWQSTFLSDASNDPFLFYFEEGVEYTIHLECSLGSLKEYIQAAEKALSDVNASYLRVIQLTGTSPDEYNDSYDFMKIMPDVLINILEHAKSLANIHEDLKEFSGTNGAHIATLEMIYTVFNTAGSDRGRNLVANLATLKSNLGTLGTWINDSKTSSVVMDSIYVIPSIEGEDGAPVADSSKLPRVDANFFESLWFEITGFFKSFFLNYDHMGVTAAVSDNVESIDVWIAAGRDQAQIWRTMIDAKGGFTDTTGVAISLKLITAGTLLPSILSRKGPDVYLGLADAEVINYAIRDAVLGVNGLDPKLSAEQNAVFTTEYYTYRNDDGTFDTVTDARDGETPTFVTNTFNKVVDGNFAKAAMDTITISPGMVKDENGNNVALPAAVYGIPRTMTFSMMFYRMDILANIGYEVPETWDDLLAMLPVLQSNNMEIGVSGMATLMTYQKGGSQWKYTDTDVYDDVYAGARTDIDSEIALEAFEFNCRLYSDYSFPVSFDAANRFRTGEMPLVMGGYTTLYNQLVVYATEIAGLWRFCSIPGSIREDGSFNYDTLVNITTTIILNGCDDRGNLLPAWQFTQWETGAERSAEFGNRIVAIMGPSAKYEAANLHAIDGLSWTATEKAAIKNQMDHLASVVNYPGSYIIGRYVNFAFLDAINKDVNPVDAIRSYISTINTEIWRKREEFDLWVPANDNDEPPEKAVNGAGPKT